MPKNLPDHCSRHCHIHVNIGHDLTLNIGSCPLLSKKSYIKVAYQWHFPKPKTYIIHPFKCAKNIVTITLTIQLGKKLYKYITWICPTIQHIPFIYITFIHKFDLNQKLPHLTKHVQLLQASHTTHIMYTQVVFTRPTPTHAMDRMHVNLAILRISHNLLPLFDSH